MTSHKQMKGRKMEQLVHILHLEDDAKDAELVQAMLESAGMTCQITRVQTRAEFDSALRQGGFDIILADFRLPMFDGVSALRLVQELGLDVPFIFVSGTMGEDAVIEGLSVGATDYVLKQKLPRLAPAVKRALRDAENRRERRRVDEALHESEERFRTIADFTYDWETWIDPEGRYIYVSPACERITGYSAADFLSDPELLLRITHPDDVEQVAAHYSKIVRTGAVSFDFQIIHRDGTPRWIAHACQPVFDQNGNWRGRRASLRDITERKRVEEALRESEARYRALAEAAPDMIFVIDRDDRVQYVNTFAARQFGATPEQVIGKPRADLFPPDIAGQQGRSLRHVFDSGQPLFNESPLRFGEREIWISNWLVPLRDESGVVTAVMGISRDITERKRAEEALRRLNRELRAISLCNQTILGAVDEQTLLNDICRIICDEAGYRLAWVGYPEHDDAKTVHPLAWAGFDSGYIADAKLTWADDTERGRGPAGKAIRSGEMIYVQDFVTDPQMAPWRESALQRGYRSGISLPLKDESAKVFGVLLIYSSEPNAITPDEIRLMGELSRDLAFGIVALRTRAERNRAEKALAQERNLLRTLIDNLPDYVWIKDAESRFVVGNVAVAQSLGKTRPEEIYGKSDFDFHPPELAARYYADEQQILRSGQPLINREEPVVEFGGKSRWLLSTKVPLRGSHGEVVGLVGIGRDITERVQAEEEIRKLNAELEQRVAERTAELSETAARLSRREAALQTANEKLKELDHLKSQFVANVSHELRTPLTNIKSYLFLLDRGKPEKRAQYMTTLRNETDLLQRLIEDLLDLSQLDRGKARFDLAPVDVNRLVAMLVDARALLVSQHRLTLEVHTEPGLPAVLADAQMLMQVLTNLIANAVNYTPAGGSIVLSSGLQRSDDQTWVTLTVKDTGLGITPEDQAHLFERFYRGDAARQVGVAGTGLGLSICQEIVARHNGKITLASQVGQGSTFTVWLPAATHE